MLTNIGISDTHRAAIAVELNKILADESVVYMKTRKAHWNVEGIDFMFKHTFFEAQYRQLEEMIDTVAERIRMLGHYAVASMRAFLEQTDLLELQSEQHDSRTYLQALLDDHEAIIRLLRPKIDRFANEYKDAGTTDFLTGLLEAHEKIAWFLRAHLK